MPTAPRCIKDAGWPWHTEHPGSSTYTNRNGIASATVQAFTTSPITTIAVSNAATDAVLVGNATGEVYRAIRGADGKQFEAIIFSVDPPSAVTAIAFASDSVALIGYNSGLIYKVTNPFGASPTITPLGLPAGANPVVAFANNYGESQEVYAATEKSVWRTANGGVNWANVTGTALTTNLSTGVDIVGLVRDPHHPFLYVATGHRRLRNAAGADWYSRYNINNDPAVWQSPLTATGAWTRFDQGLPKGLPISGLGLSPSQALYIGTQGRGIWWRRDVTAVLPNSGVNTPAQGVSVAGIAQRFVTTCSYTGGWRTIHALDFKLALGFGPAAGEPFALHVQYDENANLVRFFDPDTGAVSEGPPGADQVLSSRFAQLRLAGTSVRGIGSADPKDTVEIVWDVVLLAPAAGDLQQYLQVTDDAGASTGFDRVGSWQVQVGSTAYLGVVSNAVGS